jgi:2-oxoglutarate dehydrogenase E1 component
MGAWEFIRPQLEELIGDRWPLSYIGRPRRASPAEGSASWHAVNQRAIIERAFQAMSDTPTATMPVSGSAG